MLIEEGMSEQQKFDFFYNKILDNGTIMNAGKLLQRGYENFPENTALIYKDRFVSYKELYHRSCLFGKKLVAQGVKPSDRVLLFFRNSLEFYVAYFAIWQVGAIVAPLNIFLSERELAHIVNDSKPKLIVVSSDKIDFFRDDNSISVLTEKDMDLTSEVPQNLPAFDIPSKEPNDLVVLLYTSGTTGFPKGVMLSSKNIMTNVVQVLSLMPFSESQRVFCVLPLFHCFAQNTCIWASLFSGSTVVVVSKISRKEILNGLKHRPTIFLGVPALYGLLCLMKTAPLSSVEYFISGGDALPDKIRMFFSLLYRRKLCNGYGLTETSPLIAVNLEDVIEPTNNIGVPVLGVDCSIRNENGHELTKGQTGELWVKGDNIMLGYYNDREKTEEVIVDGWFNTGDLAKFDKNGKLIICGRLKDLIIHKGLNIYPQEIENVILKHDAVLRVGVIGQDDNSFGQIPIAVVQLRSKSENIEKELRDLCAKDLAAYKVPRRFIIVGDMPLTSTSKVDKKNLRNKSLIR